MKEYPKNFHKGTTLVLTKCGHSRLKYTLQCVPASRYIVAFVAKNLACVYKYMYSSGYSIPPAQKPTKVVLCTLRSSIVPKSLGPRLIKEV